MKRLLIGIASCVMFFSLSSICFSQWSFDLRSGNSYYRSRSSLYGSNWSTGSSWSTFYSPDRMSGFDSRGNYWQYDYSTRSYLNFGTGEIRNHRSRQFNLFDW